MVGRVVEGDVATDGAAGDHWLGQTQGLDESVNELGVGVNTAMRLPVHRIGARVPRQIQRVGMETLFGIKRQDVLVLE